MARFELKRNGWLVGISALMISTAVWADDVTTVPELPDDSGLVVADDGGVQTWHDINPGAVDDGSDLTASDDGSGGETIVADSTDGTDTTAVDDGSGDGTSAGDGTDTTVVDDGSGDTGDIIEPEDRGVQFWHDLNPGAGDDGSDTTATDDGSGDGTSAGDGTDVPVINFYGTIGDGGIPEVVYTMVSGACADCGAATNDVVMVQRSVTPETAAEPQIVAHEETHSSGDRCDGAAIAWLCEWKTGKSN